MRLDLELAKELAAAEPAQCWARSDPENPRVPQLMYGNHVVRQVYFLDSLEHAWVLAHAINWILGEATK